MKYPSIVPAELPVDPENEDHVTGIEHVWIARAEAQATEVDESQSRFFAELQRRKETKRQS